MSLTNCFFAKVLYSLLPKNSAFAFGVEIAIVVGCITALFVWQRNKGQRNKRQRRKLLSNEEKSDIIDRWIPDPLVDDVDLNHPVFEQRIISGAVGKRITVNGIDCLNMGTHNYLGLLDASDIKESAIASVHKYGVGSCGPRGFYGTIDVHLELEKRIAEFMEMEEAVVYSYGFSTSASAISAYCKRSDVVFVDECVNFALQKGLDASRSRIVFFKHNDMDDLERCLKEHEAIERKNPKKAARTRRFLIVEAIYMNTGEMCPLVELVALRKMYKLRLILDESISFGAIGAHGRGLTEFLNVDRKEVDLICSSLENAIGSIGGFSVGSTFIVDHQRLSGLGYCFSASAPPLLAQAAITALDHFEKEPNMFNELNISCTKLDAKLKNLSKFTLRGHELSPVKHLYLKNDAESRQDEASTLEQIVSKCFQNKLAITCARYLNDVEKHCPRPSIRIIANRLLTEDDIQFVFDTLETVSIDVMKE